MLLIHTHHFVEVPLVSDVQHTRLQVDGEGGAAPLINPVQASIPHQPPELESISVHLLKYLIRAVFSHSSF